MIRYCPRLDPADVAVGLVGAALLLPVELAALGPDPIGLWFTAAMLFGALGLALGVLIAVTERFARPIERPWVRALVRALPSLVASVPLGQTLFEGAFASTLPGAALAPFWFPPLVVGGVAAGLGVGQRLIARPPGQLVVAVACLLVVIGLDRINRTVQSSEYPDIHTFLLVVECVGAGLGARLLSGVTRLPWPRPTRAQVAFWRVLVATVLVGTPIALVTGLQDNAAKWAVAKRGMHTRMLVRLVRGVLDFDADGYSRVLGGGDCDDGDPDVHPGAVEVPDNDIDENCDGITDSSAATAELVQSRQEHLQRLDAWRDSPAVEALLSRTSKMNIVLFAVDALRADMLRDTPANRAAFPNMFALLDESRWFTHAFAPSAGTDLSMSGLFTGRIDPWASDDPTLGEALAETGRITHAVIPSEVLRYVGRTILTRGFDDHDRLVNDRFERDVGSYTTSSRTTDLGVAFIETWAARPKREPFFLWLHYFDVHEHHEVKGRDKRLRERGVDLGELDRAGRYRLMMSLVDEELGRVMASLTEHDALDETMVVFASDHGESLGEDDRLPINHGRFVYNALVHVPMAVRVPGTTAARVDRAVSLLDIYPTLLELAGAHPGHGDGTSLLPHLLDEAPPELTDTQRPLPLNETDQFGVVRWPHKLMVRRTENIVELYDLARDFGETQDLSNERPDLVRQLRAAYAALPGVQIDRTRKGRRARERAARGTEPLH